MVVVRGFAPESLTRTPKKTVLNRRRRRIRVATPHYTSRLDAAFVIWLQDRIRMMTDQDQHARQSRGDGDVARGGPARERAHPNRAPLTHAGRSLGRLYVHIGAG